MGVVDDRDRIAALLGIFLNPTRTHTKNTKIPKITKCLTFFGFVSFAIFATFVCGLLTTMFRISAGRDRPHADDLLAVQRIEHVVQVDRGIRV